MVYEFKCTNSTCNDKDKIKEVRCRMSEVSDPKPCDKCKEPMSRVYSKPSIGTGDGFKH